MRIPARQALGLLFCPLLFTALCAAQDAQLSELSIEELMNVEVTSVSKAPETRWEAPAAVYVIGEEDLRRSGARSIPEALRVAPGVQVARINSNSWAISIRGFNGFYANKLLVLVDGRSVYSPLFNGVYWDELDMPLDLVERIRCLIGLGH